MFTECGLPGISQIPYGAHMCHLYRGRDDLAALLVSWFTAGLRANERCIWITSAPLHAADAAAELAKAGVDVAAARKRGALQIVDFSDWHLRDIATLGQEEVCALWLAEERDALQAGFSGLRVTGNASFLTHETWDAFMDYEHAVELAFRGRRIVGLCTYAMQACGATGALDLLRRHNCALDRPETGWKILTAA
jgi:two-component system, sensor histidine kinase PdtaS